MPRSVPFLLALLALTACTSAPDPAPGPSPDPAPFRLSVADARVPVLRGSSRAIEVIVERDPGFSGPVVLSASGLPSGASAAPVTVAADATAATLVVRAAASAPHSLPTAATLRGGADADGDGDDEVATRPLTVTVRGAPGELDASFAGGASRAVVGAGAVEAQAVAVQPDGRVLVAGHATVGGWFDIAVVRFERDGSLDAGFGDGGAVLLPVGSGHDRAHALALQPDGRILVAGSADLGSGDADGVVLRLEPDGDLDPGFGTGGVVRTSFGPSVDRLYALALQADGAVVAAGESYQGDATGDDFALVRLRADGSLDAGFGAGGRVVLPVAADAGSDAVHDLLLQEVAGEVRIVAVGGEGDFALARFTSAGGLDASFGTGGTVRGVFGLPVGAARDVEEDAEGRLVVAGHARHAFALARFSADGELDAGFGDAGTVLTSLSAVNWNEAESLAIQADGRIVVGGWSAATAASKGDLALVRYDADGSLDAGFGDGGIALTPLPGGYNFNGGRAVALQEDDRVPAARIVLAGYDEAFVLARYWP